MRFRLSKLKVTICCCCWLAVAVVVNGDQETCQKEGDDGCPPKHEDDESVETVGKIDYSLNELNYDDPKLIELLKRDYLIPPPSPEEPYNFTTSKLKLDGKLATLSSKS